MKVETRAKADKGGVVITPSVFEFGHVELAGLVEDPERWIEFSVEMSGEGSVALERIEIRKDHDAAQK